MSLAPISEDNPFQVLIADSNNDPVGEPMILKLLIGLHNTNILIPFFSERVNCNFAMRNTEHLEMSSGARRS